MTLFSLRVNINPCELPNLIRSGYRLCISRKVGTDFTVVWKAIQTISVTNVFHFSSDFQVFRQHSCRSGSPVACKDFVPVCNGQKLILDCHGNFQPASGDIKENASILVSNKHVLTYFGMTSYDYHSSSYIPMFIQKHPTCFGFSACLSPTRIVKVWFQRDVGSSTIITSTTNCYAVDLTDGSKTITYLGSNLWYEGPELTFCTGSPISIKLKSTSAVQSPIIHYTVYFTHSIKSNYNRLVFALSSHLTENGYKDISINVDLDYSSLQVSLKKEVEYEEIHDKYVFDTEHLDEKIQSALMMFRYRNSLNSIIC